MSKTLYRFSVFFSVFAFICVLIIFPADISEAVRSALFLCANSVVPSLFPFFAASNLITALGASRFCEKYLKRFMRPLFSVGASLAPALFIGLIGGYPVGAAACASTYNSGLCTRDEAERALAFCNNCGPAFILGAVGGGIFASAKAGTALLVIHIAAALTVGLLLRLLFPLSQSEIRFAKRALEQPISFPAAFTASVSKALSSALSVSAYVILFSVLVRALGLLRILHALGGAAARLSGFSRDICEAFMSGVLEMTVGAFSLARCGDFTTAFILISFLLGWGGLSVHCQALSFISESGLSARQYFIGKLLHGGISVLYAFICTRLIHFEAVAVFSDFRDTYAEVNVRVVILFILCLFCFFCKKGWKKVK